jgi:hypothetical protein
MFKELINHNGNGRERPELNGAYTAIFRGVSQRQRPTFETRNAPEPVMEDVFVFEFEVEDDDGNPLRVSKWVRKPTRLTHPSKNGKVTNLYRVLAALYGVAQMTDAQLERAEEFVENEAIGREYQLTLETKPSGWVEIVHIAPVRKARNRKKEEDEEVPF